jgi:hypothetical protein
VARQLVTVRRVNRQPESVQAQLYVCNGSGTFLDYLILAATHPECSFLVRSEVYNLALYRPFFRAYLHEEVRL